MKNRLYFLTLTVALILAGAQHVRSQSKINLASPIKDISYGAGNSRSNVIVKVTLRPIDIVDPKQSSIPSSSSFTVNYLQVTNSDGQIGKAHMDKDPLDEFTYIFTIKLQSSPHDSPLVGGVIYLKPDWQSFKCSLNYTYEVDSSSATTQPSQIPSTETQVQAATAPVPAVAEPQSGLKVTIQSAEFKILKTLISPAEEAIKIGTPIWEVDGEVDGKKTTNYLAIPIIATNPISLSVYLKKDGVIIAEGSGVVGTGISKNADGTPGDTIELRENSNSGHTVAENTGYRLEVVSNRAGTQVTPQFVDLPNIKWNKNYTFKREPKFPPVHYYTGGTPWKFEVETTTSGKLFVVFMNGKKFDAYGTKPQYEINLDGFSEGSHIFQFEGVGENGQIFNDDKFYVLRIDTKTKLVGNTGFSYDDKTDKLKLNFALNRKVKATVAFPDFGNSAQIEIEPSPTPGKGEDGSPIYNYETEIDISSATELVAHLNRKAGNASETPVILNILGEKKGNNQEIVASFTLRAVKVSQDKLLAAFQKATEATDDVAKVNHLKAGLGITATPTTEEQAAIDHLLRMLKDQGSNKQKFIGFLKIAGKVAAAYFGIPIPVK